MIDGCARHEIGAIAPWRDQVEACGLEEAAERIRDAGLRVSGLCRGGMFPASNMAGLQANIDDNRRAIDEAATLGAECLVLVVGGLPGGSRDIEKAREQVVDGMRAVLEAARGENPDRLPSAAWFRTRKGRGYGKYDNASHGVPHARHSSGGKP